MTRRRFAVAGVVAIALLSAAHVGNSNAYFEGAAGPYTVRVIVRTPGVIPGLAQISVRMLDGTAVERVTVRPLRYDAGLEGAPPPDTAVAVAGEADLYAAELWLMTAGSYSVHVDIVGEEGEGSVFVPVLAVPERRLEMNVPMAIALIGAGAFLFVGALTVFGAAVRESVIPPGEQPDTTRRRKGRRAMVGGGIVLAATVWFGWNWWDAVDRSYRNSIFRPFHVTGTVDSTTGVLTFAIDDEDWQSRRWTPLIPDHGKMMHMFVVNDADLSSFAHVHPVRSDVDTFLAKLPPLPAGRYRIYGDVVHASGFTQTLTDTVDVFASAPHPDAERLMSDTLQRDPDDSWALGPAVGSAIEKRYALPSGRTMEWHLDGPVDLETEISLRFSVEEADGSPSALEPYMGMLGHAAVSRDDGSVFVHLHPSGSINMAAQRRFERAETTDSVEIPTDIPDTTARAPHIAPSSTVSFPFEFNTPGPYRIWVQIKVDGIVETGVFDVTPRETT